MYSGYLATNAPGSSVSNGSIHYTFVESLGNSTTDPVILWLNGGPGCSSLFGLFEEIGPYLQSDFEVWNKNNYTWLQNASILVLESPFGVGFSYNTTAVNYTENDTAIYNYYALLNWFESFSAFKSLPFWITGESYAGMYIPYLTSLIINNTATNKINLKGIMVGNGVLVTDDAFNNNTLLNYFANHNLFSPQLLSILNGVCPNDPLSASCLYAQQEAASILTRVNPYGNLLIYKIVKLILILDIYGYCSYSTGSKESSKPFPYYVNFLNNEETLTTDTATNDNISPCLDSSNLQAYLNLTETIAALNINTTMTKSWSDCNSNVKFLTHYDNFLYFLI